MIRAIFIAVFSLMVGVSAAQAQDTTPQVGELVTNAQFAATYTELNYGAFPQELRIGPPLSVTTTDQPYQMARWHEANAFCEFYGGQLPTFRQLDQLEGGRAAVNEWLAADGAAGYPYISDEGVQSTSIQTFLFAEHVYFRCVDAEIPAVEASAEVESECPELETWFAEQDILSIVKEAYARDCVRIDSEFFQPAKRQEAIDEMLTAETLGKVTDCQVERKYPGWPAEDIFAEQFSRFAVNDEILHENFPWFTLVLDQVIETEGMTFCAIASAIVNYEIDFSTNYTMNSAFPTIIVTSSGGNFRSTPVAGGNANILDGNVQAGEELYLLAVLPEWYLVERDHIVGFVSRLLFS